MQNPGELFSGLDADAFARITTATSDVAVVLSPDGLVLDIAYRDRSLKAWDLEEWVGRSWSETVTTESRDKIDNLLLEAEVRSLTRSRQVNHPAKGRHDLPVGYLVVSFFESPYRIALGTDLRVMAQMQQRLVRAQIDMEKDYRKLRDIEQRYRILFHIAAEPLFVVDAQTLKILDANEGLARLLNKPIKKLLGLPAAFVFAKGDQTLAVERLSAMTGRSSSEVFHAYPASETDSMVVTVTPFRETGRTNLLVSLTTDEGIPAEGAASKANIAEVVENLPLGVVIIDSSGIIIEANPAFLDLIRVVTLDLIEDRGLDKWLGGSSVDLQVLMANLREHGAVRRFSSVIRNEGGGTESVEISAVRVAGRDGVVFGLVIREMPPQSTQPPELGGEPGGSTKLTDLVGRVPLKDLVRDTAEIIEKLCIETALSLTDDNRASAADMLGLSRQSLYNKLKRYGILQMDDAGE